MFPYLVERSCLMNDFFYLGIFRLVRELTLEVFQNQSELKRQKKIVHTPLDENSGKFCNSFSS